MSQTFAELQAASENVRAARKILGAVLAVAPLSAPVPGPLTSDGLKINAMPEEYVPVGLLSPDGINFAREVSMSSVDALGHFSPIREDPESASRSMTFTALEVHNRQVIELSEAMDLAAAQVAAASGEVSYEVPDLPNVIFYRALVIGFDGSLAAPFFDGVFYPCVSVTSFPSETWNKTDPRQAEIGLTAYTDPDLGYIVKKTIAGLGFKAQAAGLGWTVASS